MLKKKEVIYSFLFFAFLSVVLFWQVFVHGYHLFPGSYLVAWFEPYKSENIQNGTIVISHKPVADDVFRHIYPFKTLAIDMLRQGKLPLWNPYNGAGQPLLATVNSGLIDPFNVLFFVFPYIQAWDVYLFLQFLLIGFFTYLYCRTIGFNRRTAYFSAIVFSLSGVVIARLSLGAYGLGIAMLPLILFSIESYILNKKTNLIFIIPFAIFALITSTHPQIGIYVLTFCTLYLIAREYNLKQRFQDNLKILLPPLLLIILGVGLSAIQILPTVELLKYANFSTETSSYVVKFLVPIYHLVSILIPNYFGNGATYNFWGPSDYIETVAAIGLIPCLFAFLSIYIKKGNQVRNIYLVTLIATLLIAVGSPISKLILKLPIPILSTDPPSRIFLLTSFSLSILAGIGFNYFLENSSFIFKKIKLALPYLVSVAVIVLVSAYLYKTQTCAKGLIEACFQVGFRNTILESGVFGFGFILFLFVTKKSKVIPILLIMLVAAIGLYNAEKFLPFSPVSSILPSTPFLKELQSVNGRIFGFGDSTVTQDLATYFKFYDPEYYHPLYIKRYGELMAYSNTGKFGQDVGRSDAIIRNEPNLSGDDNARRIRLLNLIGVNTLIYSNGQGTSEATATGVIWKSDVRDIVKSSSLPRIYVVSNYKIASSNTNILKTLFSKDFNAQEDIVLENRLPFKFEGKVTWNIGKIKDVGNEISFNTKSDKEGLLVLLDNYYPGWKAYVDGRETHIYRANYTFRTIVLPKGLHVVTFIYDPISVKLGLVISGISLIATLTWLLRRKAV